ncbi:MAG: ribosome maturation factor RimP [Erysipelotrichia bacterium]|nr:ribosome maturation factor RimP [Erysipelotrichia bacterium]
MLSIQRVDELIKPVLKENNIAKYHIDILKQGQMILQISLEKSDGTMDLDTCEKISNQISKVLDQYDDDNTQYMLDVCSFGIEKQLYSVEEVKQHINDYVHVELYNPQNGMDSFEGYLTEFANNQIKIDYLLKGVKKHATIDYANIKLIRLAVKF